MLLPPVYFNVPLIVVTPPWQSNLELAAPVKISEPFTLKIEELITDKLIVAVLPTVRVLVASIEEIAPALLLSE